MNWRSRNSAPHLFLIASRPPIITLAVPVRGIRGYEKPLRPSEPPDPRNMRTPEHQARDGTSPARASSHCMHKGFYGRELKNEPAQYLGGSKNSRGDDDDDDDDEKLTAAMTTRWRRRATRPWCPPPAAATTTAISQPRRGEEARHVQEGGRRPHGAAGVLDDQFNALN